MNVRYRTQGLVLKIEDRGEADQNFIIYTKDFGKLKILGKAIRKIKSKLRAGINLFYLSEIEFIQGKTYKTLTDAILIKKFRNISNSLEKLKISSQIAEAVDNLIAGQEQDEGIWNLLIETFDKLEIEDSFKVENSKLEIIYYYFIWNLLAILGYQIDLYYCVKCQERLVSGIMNFSSESNGIICLKCSDDTIKDKILISSETIKIVRFFLDRNWEILLKLKFEKKQKKELEKISQSYLDFILREMAL